MCKHIFIPALLKPTDVMYNYRVAPEKIYNAFFVNIVFPFMLTYLYPVLVGGLQSPAVLGPVVGGDRVGRDHTF